MPFSERIDTHSHFLPDFYRTALQENGHSNPDGMPAIPEWSEENHLQLMKDLNITKAILSISSPGTNLTPSDTTSARALTRQCNTFASSLCKRRPESFGFWASLPLPDVEGSLSEIAFAIDHLNAAGFTLETNHHGIYLGDSTFDSIFNELNRRQATVFIHPTAPCINHLNHQGQNQQAQEQTMLLPQFPQPMFEFLFDTARAVINLFLSGTITRCPSITFIIPHAGGALPPLIERFASIATSMSLSPKEVTISSDMVKETFKRQFYFDLAGFPFPDQIHGLLRYVGPERLVYGSDYPFTPARAVLGLAIVMEGGLEKVFGDEEIKKRVLVENSRRLLGLKESQL